MISIDEMENMLNELAAELPEEFFRELNGGVILLSQAKLHPESKGGGLYALGEYYSGGAMGRYIAIYYGSFIKVYGGVSVERLRAELRKTLRHEMRHHLESLSGERDLEIEDEQYIAKYLLEHRQKLGGN
ncbi:MAG: metallopeptidase family protein [Burkholderiales bacterium]